MLRRIEWDGIRAEFREIALERSHRLRETLHLAESDLTALAAYSVVGGEWEEESFRRLASQWLSKNDSFRALDWRPRVLSGNRVEFESQVRAAGYPEYQIIEADARGELIRAGDREDYFPIRFVQPEPANIHVLGFDLGFEAVRREALEHARDSGQTTVSGRVLIPHIRHGEPGLLLVAPVYGSGYPIETDDERRGALAGFCVAVLQPQILARKSRRPLKPVALELVLNDASGGGTFLASDLAADEVDGQYGDRGPEPRGDLSITDQIPFGNRTWTAVFTPAPGFPGFRRSYWPWSVLLLGLMTTAGVSAFVVYSDRHAIRLAGLVSELARVNQSLRHSEQNLAITLHSIGDGVLVTDAARHVVRLNPAAERLTGWSQAEALNRPVDEVFRIINEETRRPAEIPIDDVLATGEIHGLANHTVLISRDGREWAIADSAAPIRGEDGTLFGVVLVFRDVTEERQIARQIRELNENLENLVAERTTELRLAVTTQKTVLNSLPALIAMVDPSGTIVTVNEAWRRSRRTDVLQRGDYAIGQNYVSLCEDARDGMEADASLAVTGLREVLSGARRIFEHEYHCRSAEGDHWYRLTVTPLDGDSLHGAVIMHLDVTERKQGERIQAWEAAVLEAVSSGMALSELLEHIVHGVEEIIPGMIASILLVDPDGIHLRHGAAPGLPDEYNRILDGIAAGPAVGSCGTAVHRRERVIVSDIETDPLWADYLELARHFDLKACWSIPVIGSAGNVLATFALYCRNPRVPRDSDLKLIDRTAHVVQIALERHHQQTELRASEERFQLLSRATNDAIWDWNIVTNDLWWSDGFEAQFGYRRDDVHPEIDSWLNRIHPEDRERILSDVRRAIDDGKADWSGAYRYRRKDGSYAEVLDRGHVIRDDSGKPIRMIGGMTDQTERRSLEAQLLQSQKMEAIGQMAGGIAHDFNNLLTIILGYAEVLLSTTPPGSPGASMLAGIQDAGERAANLTLQLLAFSRKQILAPRLLNLNTVVRDAERMLSRLIGEDIEIVTDLRPTLSQIRIDPGQLQQVIINLAVNARDAMPTGGRLAIATSEVEIAEPQTALLDCRPGRYVALTIADTGTGMTPEIQGRIFEPFFTTKGHGKGTGLGLPTVFGIVKQSDGAIEVASQIGAGTSFRILFPAVPEQLPASPSVHPEARSGSETILVVEDEPNVRQIARVALQTHGYRVLDAAGTREALRLIESAKSPIDLVITDVVMPEMSGRELADQLRSAHPAIRVLFMSGYTDDAVLRHGVSDATGDFLQKPFRPHDLVRKVRDLLDR